LETVRVLDRKEFFFSEFYPNFAFPVFLGRMKNDIHPEYHTVIFKDVSTEHAFLGKSTLAPKETQAWEDGNEYPVIKLDISSDSHPFFTGVSKFVDTAGRVDKFYSRYGKK
jgi:large subunit ribosomal protein L31